MGSIRKRMQYLSLGGSPGDTANNSWLVPLVPVANMAKVTQASHAEIVARDAADDSGAEDGAGTAVTQALRGSVITFPREWHEKLAREMIHASEIDVCALWHPGFGKSVLAFILGPQGGRHHEEHGPHGVCHSKVDGGSQGQQSGVGHHRHHHHHHHHHQKINTHSRTHGMGDNQWGWKGAWLTTHGHGRHAHRGRRGRRAWSRR